MFNARWMLGLLIGAAAYGATLEKLTVEQMAQKSTSIVRGRVTGCAGEARGSVIYTRCGVAVSETWKGTAASKVEFLVPGGVARGLMQNFSGAPKFQPDEQYVLFLWTGRSGIPQIIGLSQGVFGVGAATDGTAVVRRQASSEPMVSASGLPLKDTAVEMPVDALRSRVRAALAGAAN